MITQIKALKNRRKRYRSEKQREKFLGDKKPEFDRFELSIRISYLLRELLVVQDTLWTLQIAGFDRNRST